MSAISIRYMIEDVPAAIQFYTTHLGFRSRRTRARRSRRSRATACGCCSAARPARPSSDAGRSGTCSRRVESHAHPGDESGGRSATAGEAGVTSFATQIITGPGGSQILLDDPDGNPVELFQPVSNGSTGLQSDSADPQAGPATCPKPQSPASSLQPEVSSRKSHAVRHGTRTQSHRHHPCHPGAAPVWFDGLRIVAIRLSPTCSSSPMCRPTGPFRRRRHQ